jgi:hypothetical protein
MRHYLKRRTPGKIDITDEVHIVWTFTVALQLLISLPLLCCSFISLCSHLSLTNRTSCTLHSTMHNQSMTHLPVEVLLDIFLQLALVSPRSVPRLAQVCRHFSVVLQTYDSLIWKVATLSTFPTIGSTQVWQESRNHPIGSDMIVDDVSNNRAHSLGTLQSWSHLFRVHDAWANQTGQTFVVSSPSSQTLPTTMSMDHQASLIMQESSSLLHQHVIHHHDHHHMQGLLPASQSFDTRNEGSFHFGVQSTSLLGGTTKSSLSPNHSVPTLQWAPYTRADTWKDTLSCSSCTYAEVCLIPQAGICVKTQRQRSLPLMRVINAESLDQIVDLDDSVHAHHDLISGLAVNDEGTLLVSCSIDSTVRVWDVQSPFFFLQGRSRHSFQDLVGRYGCPIQNRHVLNGHIGWVNGKKQMREKLIFDRQMYLVPCAFLLIFFLIVGRSNLYLISLLDSGGT